MVLHAKVLAELAAKVPCVNPISTDLWPFTRLILKVSRGSSPESNLKSFPSLIPTQVPHPEASRRIFLW